MDLRAWVRSLPNFRTGAFWLFVAVAVISIVLSDQPIAAHLLLTPGPALANLELWQPITANFIYPNGSLGLLFGTFAIQWFVGGELEGFWGVRKYLGLVLACGLAGHVVSLLLGLAIPAVAATTVGGATAIDLAALTAFAVVFGERPLQLLAKLPLNARTLALLIIGLTLASPLLRGAPWPTVVPWLVAMLGALLVTTQPWQRLRESGKVRKAKRRSHLRVVPPDPTLLN